MKKGIVQGNLHREEWNFVGLDLSAATLQWRLIKQSGETVLTEDDCTFELLDVDGNTSATGPVVRRSLPSAASATVSPGYYQQEMRVEISGEGYGDGLQSVQVLDGAAHE